MSLAREPDTAPPTAPGSRRWRRLGLGACALVVVACSLLYAAMLAGPIEYRGDLLQDWASGRNYLAGMPVYASLSRSVLHHTGESYRGLPVNAHPPAAVLVFLPFAGLEYPTAYRSWVVLSLVLLGLATWGITRELGLSAWTLLPVAAVLLAGRPLEEEVVQGQFNALLVALVAAAWVLDRRGRPLASGLLVGLATAIKLLPGFLALYFVGRRSVRGLAGVVLGFVLLDVAALAVLGRDPFDVYLRQVLPASALYHESWHNGSLWGLWYKLFDPQRFTLPLHRLPALARFGPLATSSALALAVVVGVRRARAPAGSDRAFALSVLGMLLASPLLWEHYLLLALLPLLVLWSQTAPGDRSRVLLVAAAALLTLPRQSWMFGLVEGVLGAPVQDGAQRLARPGHTLTVLAYPAYTLLALFVACWLPGARRPRTP